MLLVLATTASWAQVVSPNLGSVPSGPATSGQLWIPTGVTVDSAGNLFIADSQNNRIRRVAAASGIITTVAGTGVAGFSGDGGPATNAVLNIPYHVAVDAAGNLFIADAANDRIRQVAAGSGIITTVAGTGDAGFGGDGGPATSAQLWSPTGVVVDAGGNLFIADADNNRIRRVAAGSRIIATVAGSGGGSIDDGGPATDAQLSAPTGVALDATGNFFIADAEDNRIRRVAASTGIISTVAGTGGPGFSGDGGPATTAQLSTLTGVAIDGTGNVYIADADAHRIRQVEAGTGLIATVAGTGVAGSLGDDGLATGAQLRTPTGVAVDDAGNLFIADADNNRIRRVAGDTGIITTIAGTGIPGFSGDGGLATNAQLSVSYGVTLDVAGNLFIADTGNKRVRAVDLTASALPPEITSANETSATFTFVGAESGVVRFSCQLDGRGFTPCVSPQSYPGPPALGEHIFQVTVTNQFGHTSPPSTYTWTTTTPIVTLTVVKQGQGRGSVTSSPEGISCGATCRVNYQSGTWVTLTAMPDAGSTFIGWSGGGCSGTGPCIVMIGATTEITASFSRIVTLTVTRTGTGSGTVASSPAGISCGIACSASFLSGTILTLTASPTVGSVFVGWSGGGCSGTAPCVLTMTDAFVTATFSQTFVLTVSTAGAGTVTSNPAGIDCGSTCSASFASNTSVTLTANPAPGSVFTGWSGGGCASTAPCVVAMTAANSVTATFTPAFALTVSTAGAGTVTSSPAGITCGATCSAPYASGTVVTLTAAPATGSDFTRWSGGGCSGTGSCVVTVTAATAVTATFTLQSFALTITKNGTGTGTVTSVPAGISCGTTCSSPFDYNTLVTLTAAPATGSTFTGWTGAGCSGTGPCAVTVTAATAVTATFTLQSFALTVTKNGTGAGTVTSTPAAINCGATCSAIFVSGTVVRLTASPYGGSVFVGWSGGGCSGTAACTVTLGGATAVTATFNLNGPFTFTDPDLAVGFSIIRAVHIMELRDAINTGRTRRGLARFSFTDPSLTVGSTTVKAVHIVELRTALNEASTAGGASTQNYTDPALGDGPTIVKAVHITELRSAVQTLP